MIEISGIPTLVFPLLFFLCLSSKLCFWGGFMISQLRPLSKIPGPKWAAYTRLWLSKTLASGKSVETFVDVNKQYGNVKCHKRDPKLTVTPGSLARIGPNHLLTSDPEVIRKILSNGSRYRRAPWFDALRIDPHVINVVSEREAKKHSRLRYILSAGASSSSGASLYPILR